MINQSEIVAAVNIGILGGKHVGNSMSIECPIDLFEYYLALITRDSGRFILVKHKLLLIQEDTTIRPTNKWIIFYSVSICAQCDSARQEHGK